MRVKVLAIVLLLFAGLVLADDSSEQNKVTGLELPEPLEKTRPGYAKISAKCDAKCDIRWDVEAQFDDADVEFRWELRDEGKSVQVVIPDSSGIIRVTAIAILDGKFTSQRMAKTYVTVKYTPRSVAKEKAITKAVPVAGKVKDAYFIIDPAGDANINALVTSSGLRNALRKLGVEGHTFPKDSENAVRFAPYVKDAGGVPAMILVTGEKKVKKAVRVPATSEAILAAMGNAK